MIYVLLARLRSLWRSLRHRGDIETAMREEFRQHIELRTEHLMREGLTPREAARRARDEFGDPEAHREAARASRGLRFFDRLGASLLDVKLGVRMLRKYPGLSLVSVLGMAVAIAIGAGSFAFVDALLDPSLPLERGDRVVSILTYRADDAGDRDRRTLHDFVLWRDEVASVRELSAFRTASRNIVTETGQTALVTVAQMTASGFRVARVAPADIDAPDHAGVRVHD